MIHIVFNEADVQSLQQAIVLNEELEGNITLIRDDYAVGPIQNGYLGEGRASRSAWWQAVLTGSPYEYKADAEAGEDFTTVANLVGNLQRNPTEIVWIWMAQNQHDVCGYYWLLHFLKNFQGRIHVLYLNNLPFINEKGGIFYPTFLHQIPTTEFRKAKKLARLITHSELEIDPDEWLKLSEENAMVRILEGGKKIASQPATYYDKEILSNVTKDWQKAQKLILNTLNRMKVKTGDAFLGWRIKELVENNTLEVTGAMEKGWKEYEVKFPAAN